MDKWQNRPLYEIFWSRKRPANAGGINKVALKPLRNLKRHLMRLPDLLIGKKTRNYANNKKNCSRKAVIPKVSQKRFIIFDASSGQKLYQNV